MRTNGRAQALVAAFMPQEGVAAALAQGALVLGASAFVALAARLRIDLPFTPVPITGQSVAVLLVGALLGSRLGAASLIAYWAEGVMGMPVFAGGRSGWAYFIGPSGGYIVGFILAAWLIGFLAERGWDRRPWSLAAAMLGGEVCIYLVGLPWLAHFLPAGRSVWVAGLLPFIPGDTVKLLVAAGLVPSGWAALGALGVMPGRTEPKALALPWHRIYIVGALLIIIGALLPLGAAAGETVWGPAAMEGRLALAAGAVALAGVALAWRGVLGSFSSHLWQSTAAVVAGFVAFYDIIYAVADDAFWLSSPGPGLGVIALGAVVLFLAALGEGSK